MIAPEELLLLSEELDDLSKKFSDACIEYAEHYYEFQKLLGIRLMKLEDKKIAIEKMICLALADDTQKDYNEFNLHYHSYEFNKALKIGYEAQIEAIKSKIMSRQSLMKWNGKMDTFGEVR